MKINLRTWLGAVLTLFVTLSFTHNAAAQTALIAYTAPVTDRKTHVTSYQIFSMKDDGSAAVQLSSGGGTYATWSQNQRFIAFHRSTSLEDTIYVMDAVGEKNGGRIFSVVSNGGDTGLDWNGSMIVFAGAGGNGLWIVAVDPVTEAVGTPTFVRAGNCAAPALSPDGTKVAFVSSGIIKILDLATGVESFGLSGYAPSFSPDGNLLTYRGAGIVTTTKRGKTTTGWYPEIFVANVDGTGVTQLTGQTDYVNFPKFNPTGTDIAFWQQVNSADSIQKLTLATGAVTQLKKGGYLPDW